VTKYSRAEFKKFRSLADAEAWILPALNCNALNLPWNPFPDGQAYEVIFFSSLSTGREINSRTNPIHLLPGPLNVTTSCGEDILRVDSTRDESIILSEEQADI
jgi:hypothetical protein